jgi:polysaccharide pyruvyl transferase WcaK-like protein
MSKICLLDPGIENNLGSPSSNLGDLIIQESVNREVKKIFGDQELIRFSTQEYLDYESIKIIKNSSIVLVGGTNILSSKMNEYRQWKISFLNAAMLKDAILLGVGWWQYQEKPNLYTQSLLKMALCRRVNHSVRDSYTKDQLNKIGIRNVINTGCPTMWPLLEMRPEEFSERKAESALLMLTDYNKDPLLDRKLIEILLSQYKNVYFWPQGRDDLKYAKSFELPLTFLEHSFEELSIFVESQTSFDYIGTRLHGGVYCLRSGRRSLIIEIDNRAREIAKDTGLQTAERDAFPFIENWIKESKKPTISLDHEAISQWRNQFIRQ